MTTAELDMINRRLTELEIAYRDIERLFDDIKKDFYHDDGRARSPGVQTTS